MRTAHRFPTRRGHCPRLSCPWAPGLALWVHSHVRRSDRSETSTMRLDLGVVVHGEAALQEGRRCQGADPAVRLDLPRLRMLAGELVLGHHVRVLLVVRLVVLLRRCGVGQGLCHYSLPVLVRKIALSGSFRNLCSAFCRSSYDNPCFRQAVTNPM